MSNPTINSTSDAPLESIAKIASTSLTYSPVVYRYFLQSLARELLPGERVYECLRRIVPGQETVDVLKHDLAKKAYYRNLIVCGRLWHCPVCAARISEKRRQELSAALAGSKFIPILITYTVRHNQGMKLKALLPAVLESFRKLKSGRIWQNIVSEYAWVGSIRALEVTHGVNGWHPHIHELALLEIKLASPQERGLENALKTRWEQVLKHSGHSASWEHGVDVESRDSGIREYVAKFGHEPIKPNWSLEHELTKAIVKKSRGEGRTPTQLLADYGEGDIGAGRLWKEYANVFKGRNQLVWSRGLRELLGMGKETTDAEAAAELPPEARLLGRITPSQWRAILKADLRGELLDAASTMSDEDFAHWLADAFNRWVQL